MINMYMKFKDIYTPPSIDMLREVASPGSTTVANIGSLTFVARPNQIKIFKRPGICDDNNKCIAKLQRKTGLGWRFLTTKDWDKIGLPHIGNIKNAKSPISGKKTISNDISNLLKQWGLNISDIEEQK